MAQKTLFDAFPPATRAQWEAVITKELKDKALDTLNVSVEGSVIPPFHMASDGAPTGDRRRGVKRTGNPWRATIAIDANDPDANDKLMEGLMGGADGVWLEGPVEGAVNALKDVLFGAIDIQFAEGSIGALKWSLDESERQAVAPSDLSLCAGLPHGTEVTDLRLLLAMHPKVRLFIAADLEQGRALLTSLLAQGFTIDDACARIQFRLHLGDDLFFEAARLRAFREAWAAVVDEFKPHARLLAHHLDTGRRLLPCRNEVGARERDPRHAAGDQRDHRWLRWAHHSLLLPCPKVMCSHAEWYETSTTCCATRASLARVADPLGGSYTVEQLTTQ
jgi:hypothetical protein